MTHILAIDQGTTSSRAIVFRGDCSVAAIVQQEFPQHFPQSGWVEHDPEDIWRTALATSRDAIAKAGLAARDIAAIGIANQRETALVWDRASGKPIHNAIVWQDRRTAAMCRRLKDEGGEAPVGARTGLRLDPYFSASKIAWLLEHVPGARARAERGELAFGTVDSFLLWRLTAVAGDQQAALIGQACFMPGMMKSTYGTGCFAVLNTGRSAVASRNRLLSTIAYRLGGETIYGLEGAIFVAGAAVQWLRDGIGIVPSAAATGAMAA